MPVTCRKTIACLLTSGFLLAGASDALAQYYGDDRHGPHWHGDIHHFNEYDFAYWRSGAWVIPSRPQRLVVG